MKAPPTTTLLLAVKNCDCEVARLVAEGRINGVVRTLRLGETGSEHLVELNAPVDRKELLNKNISAAILSNKYLWVTSPSCNICKILSRFPAVTDRVTYRDRGGLAQRMTVQGRFVAERILTEMKKQNLLTAVIDSWDSRDSHELTRKQLDVLMRALKMGYLDDPKKSSLIDIAKGTGTTPSTVRRHLRTATRKIIEDYIESHPSIL